jgi:hypothetical protein
MWNSFALCHPGFLGYAAETVTITFSEQNWGAESLLFLAFSVLVFRSPLATNFRRAARL